MIGRGGLFRRKRKGKWGRACWGWWCNSRKWAARKSSPGPPRGNPPLSPRDIPASALYPKAGKPEVTDRKKQIFSLRDYRHTFFQATSNNKKKRKSEMESARRLAKIYNFLSGVKDCPRPWEIFLIEFFTLKLLKVCLTFPIFLLRRLLAKFFCYTDLLLDSIVFLVKRQNWPITRPTYRPETCMLS